MISRNDSGATRGRRRFGGNALEARNTQAARDALRRRQKEKKARIVKRHVRYKQKQKLLEQLERSERPTPIVAAELCREDDDEIEETHIKQSKESERVRSTVQEQDVTDDAETEKSRGTGTKEDTNDQKANANFEQVVDDAIPAEEAKSRDGVQKKKYVPFMKEQKEFQRLKEEREAQDKEQQKRIEERQQMLRKSKKERRAKAKQVRKVTPRGQPKLKYRLDAMLARIEKQ